MAPPHEDWGPKVYPPAAVTDPSAVRLELCPPLESAVGPLKRMSVMSVGWGRNARASNCIAHPG